VLVLYHIGMEFSGAVDTRQPDLTVAERVLSFLQGAADC
jgi:hypothetical protein